MYRKIRPASVSHCRKSRTSGPEDHHYYHTKDPSAFLPRIPNSLFTSNIAQISYVEYPIAFSWMILKSPPRISCSTSTSGSDQPPRLCKRTPSVAERGTSDRREIWEYTTCSWRILHRSGEPALRRFERVPQEELLTLDQLVLTNLQI
jgi:hypothetical protein